MFTVKRNLREELTCVICCDMFREPVMLACMHRFCRPCITRYWRGTLGPVTCPQCRKEFNHKHLQTDYLVTAMVEKVRGSCSSIKDQEVSFKMELFHTQTRVRGEFRALRQILQDEEDYALEQLKKEQDEELEKVRHHLELIERALRDIEENIRMLEKASSTIETNDPLWVQNECFVFVLDRPCIQVELAPDFDANAFSNKYIAPLQYVTWRKMYKSLKPGNFRSVHLISGQYSVQMTHHKRFLQSVNVLATQGFHTGRHYWEVALGSKSKWDLGVASEAVDRHARVKLSPENGYWTLRLRKKNEYYAGTQPWTRLHLGSPLQRVGVFLDCEEKRVSFYNADDMSLIYTFTDGPRGKMFPFFSPCISNSPKPQPIQLLHYPPVALSG
uniref:Tripartite motif containing 105 n=1 Tax=Neogobius melanostomus TaxID=47308 RepID=A0A8C6TDE7_9GOBI